MCLADELAKWTETAIHMAEQASPGKFLAPLAFVFNEDHLVAVPIVDAALLPTGRAELIQTLAASLRTRPADTLVAILSQHGQTEVIAANRNEAIRSVVAIERDEHGAVIAQTRFCEAEPTDNPFMYRLN